jgi:hypothetical protein
VSRPTRHPTSAAVCALTVAAVTALLPLATGLIGSKLLHVTRELRSAAPSHSLLGVFRTLHCMSHEAIPSLTKVSNCLTESVHSNIVISKGVMSAVLHSVLKSTRSLRQWPAAVSCFYYCHLCVIILLHHMHDYTLFYSTALMC